MENTLKKIKNKEERMQIVATLESNLAKLDWISKAKSPLKEIKMKLDEYVAKLDNPKLSDEELRNIWGSIQKLKVTYSSIVSGSYIPNLKRNITADLLSVEQYDANIERRNFFEIAKGIITRDKKTKEYLQRKYLLDIASITGNVLGNVNMQLETMEDILRYIKENCDLAGIEIQSIPETSLVPMVEVQNTIYEIANDMTNRFLVERGIELKSETQNINTNEEDLIKLDNKEFEEASKNNDKVKVKEKENQKTNNKNENGLEIDE